MLVIDNGDAIRGVAEVASKLDFTVNGYVGTTATQLADGQMANSETNLYQSGADATVVTSITIVNTDSAARTFTLYLKPSGGTSRAITPVSLDLPVGYSFYTDGQRAVVMTLAGEILKTYSLHATSHTDGTDDIQNASETQKGLATELATAAEINTSTDTARVITPARLSDSIYGEKTLYIKVIAAATTLTTGDGKAYVTIPLALNGMDLVDADACIYTVSSSGEPSIQIHNLTDTSDMLSTNITIDANELNSYTASPGPGIDTGEDDVVTGDVLRIDVDVAGTGTKGLDVILVFRIP